MKVLLLLSGYTCKRIPWGLGDNGTPRKEIMSDFFEGAKYLKNLLKLFSFSKHMYIDLFY